VNFDTDGGSFVAGSSVSIGSAIPAAPTPPTKSGYDFGGWKATVGGSAVTFPYYPILTRTNAASVTSASLVDGGRYVNKGLWSRLLHMHRTLAPVLLPPETMSPTPMA
jgi:hypothetical protein